MDETSEILIKGGLSILAIVAVVLRHRLPHKLAPEEAGTLLSVMAMIAIVAWPNFGRSHGASAIHHWEQFHYFLGSKYSPELQYDGIYAASLAAEGELELTHSPQSHVRDLRDNVVVETASTRSFQLQVKERFDHERWIAFKKDVAYFLESSRYEHMSRIRLDHGYNPTPAWTFTGRLFSSWIPASNTSLALLAWIDPLLLAAMFIMIFRSFGNRIGCMVLILFGLGYPWRYDWVGGAFLRQDWLAAVGIAICLMKKNRYGGAGLLIAYATMVRVFPGAFLVGPAVVALRHLISGRTMPRWALTLFGTFLLGVLGCFAAGSFTGSGMSAWTAFADNLDKHHGTWLTNNVGMKNLLLYDVETLTRKDVDSTLSEPWLMWQAKMDGLAGERSPLLFVAVTLLLVFFTFAAWRLEVWQASILGLVVAFTAALLTCYYWAMLCLIPLGRRRWGPTVGWLGVNVLLYGLHLVTPASEMIYGSMSLMLLLFFLAWAGPDAWKTAKGIAGR